MGNLPSLAHGGVFIAEERGYFRDEGIDLSSINFDTAAQMLPAVATGDLDVSSGAVNTALFNAIARGVPLKIVVSNSSQRPDQGFLGIVIRKDLWDSGQVRDWPTCAAGAWPSHRCSRPTRHC